jgi:hypothetical protein
MNWNAIYSALEQKVQSLNLGCPVYPENVAFSSTPPNPFIEILHIPVDTVPLTIGLAGVMETEGIMRILIHFPAGSGGGAATELAGTIAKALKPGTSLPAGGGDVVFYRSTLGTKAADQDTDWWTLPVSVHYTAYHNF